MKLIFCLTASIFPLTVLASQRGRWAFRYEFFREMCKSFCQSEDYLLVLTTGMCCCDDQKVETNFNVYSEELVSKRYNIHKESLCEPPDKPPIKEKGKRSRDSDDEEENEVKKKWLCRISLIEMESEK
ncbi:hypothetical protein BDB01DRAFT_799465 [Pilobolus umbonatus]|nr:hypothetical protein BDB01DRAFT_799465 [Pilobolus umbonatus]